MRPFSAKLVGAILCGTLGMVLIDWINKSLDNLYLLDYQSENLFDPLTTDHVGVGVHLRVSHLWCGLVMASLLVTGTVLGTIVDEFRLRPAYEPTDEDLNLERAVDLSLEEVTGDSTPANSSDQIEKNVYEKRLDEANYEGDVPTWACDPVTGVIMVEPMMTRTIQNYTSRTFDESTLLKLPACDGGYLICPLTRDRIIGYTKNRELKDAIEEWVSAKAKRKNKSDNLLSGQSLFRRQNYNDKNIKTEVLRRSLSFGQ